MLNKKMKKINKVLLFSLLCLPLLAFDNNEVFYKKVNAESPYDNSNIITNTINGTDIISQNYNGGYLDYSIYDTNVGLITEVGDITLTITNDFNQYYLNFTLNDSRLLNNGFYLDSFDITWDDLGLFYDSYYLLSISFDSDIYNESTFYGINVNDEKSFLIPYNTELTYEDCILPQNFSSLYSLDNEDSYSNLHFGLHMNFNDTSYPFRFANINQSIRIPLFKLKVIEIFKNTSGIYSNTEEMQSIYNNGYQNGYTTGRTSGYTDGYNQASTEIKVNDYHNMTYDDIYNTAYNTGNTNGYTNGYNDGRSNTILNDYHNMSYTSIFDLGYNSGYTTGLSSNYSLVNEIKSLVNLPFTFAKDSLNFEVLGLNLYTLFSACITLLLIIWVIKHVTK